MLITINEIMRDAMENTLNQNLTIKDLQELNTRSLVSGKGLNVREKNRKRCQFHNPTARYIKNLCI